MLLKRAIAPIKHVTCPMDIIQLCPCNSISRKHVQDLISPFKRGHSRLRSHKKKQRQARIQDFCQGRAPREWWPSMGWEWAIFDVRKLRFATFQDVYCHIMPEWCWTTIQETPVSLLSAPETREPAPSARVLPSQGWAPAPAPPPLDPRLRGVFWSNLF